MSSKTSKNSENLRLLIIQIPCLNEEHQLPDALADLPRTVPGFDRVEWLIIDDGSTDRTVEVAHRLGADHVISHGANRGLAAAFMTGLEHSLRLGADVIVNTDADNQYCAADIPALTRLIVDNQSDLVIGERPIAQIKEFSPSKKVLQRLGTKVVRAFSGVDVRDAPSGFRALSREAALRLRVFSRYTYTMETLVQAGWEGLRVNSVEVGVNPKSRESRLVKSIPRYVFRSAVTIIRTFALYRPFRFFVILGSPFFALGLLLMVRWCLYFFLAENYGSRLPSLLIALGSLALSMQFLVVALVADLLAASRRLAADQLYLQRRSALGVRPTEFPEDGRHF